jgi:hypothetical protein
VWRCSSTITLAIFTAPGCSTASSTGHRQLRIENGGTRNDLAS